MSTHDAQEDALGGREARELQADEPVGESPWTELQIPGEAAESARLQQAEHGAGDVGGRASREQPREGHLRRPQRAASREHYYRDETGKNRADVPVDARRDRATGVNCAPFRIPQRSRCRALPSRPELNRWYARATTKVTLPTTERTAA